MVYEREVDTPFTRKPELQRIPLDEHLLSYHSFVPRFKDNIVEDESMLISAPLESKARTG